MKLLCFAAAAATLPLFATPASAQKQPADSLTRRDTPMYYLPAVEVVGARNRGYSAVRSSTATRTDTPLLDTPQSMTVITRDVIADQAMQNMSDVVRYVPGITMAQGEGHRDAPTIRGQNTTADFFVDGVRDDAQYFRDLYNVERVEALKGANAMIFGRGGGGGIINRVIKQPQWTALRAISFEGGSFDHERASVDVAQPLTASSAFRVNGMFEDSRGFRDASELHRHGVNPTFAVMLGGNTTVRAGYEYFYDRRTVDRGIPSFNGAPSSARFTTFFGNPDSSRARTRVHSASTLLEHRSSAVTIREQVRFTDYDKFYQNSYAGSAVNAAGTQVSLGAYNHATPRRNIFSQTDVIAHLGRNVEHTLLAGIELGRQRTDNVRRTGYYNGTTSSYTVDFMHPTVGVPIEFRQSPTDADNRTVATVGAAYVQDQLVFSQRWQAIAGIRLDRFSITYHNNRSNQDLARTDALVSPRAGLIFKPVEAASLYASYSVSRLPGSGDQFSSLTATSSNLEPERFTNYEVGGKWDVRRTLSLSAALYNLERTNTTAPDPADPKLIVQTGAQRTRGLELNAAGDIVANWHVVAGAAFQHAQIVSATMAAKAGATVPLVPRRTFSLWNRYDVVPGSGVGLGMVYQSEMFAAVDNVVTLPGFTRLDGAIFLRVSREVSAQVNVENLRDTRYFATSQGNNNILPGASRTVRLSLSTRF